MRRALEQFFERLTRAKEPRANGVERQLLEMRNLLIAELLVLAQHQYLAVVGLEQGQAAAPRCTSSINSSSVVTGAFAIAAVCSSSGCLTL